jgi:hypothetical protein
MIKVIIIKIIKMKKINYFLDSYSISYIESNHVSKPNFHIMKKKMLNYSSKFE